MALRSDTFSTNDISSSASETDGEVNEFHRWDNITLSDFRSRACCAVASYAWFWIYQFIQLAMLGSDSYTCVILLVFNRWPGQIMPVIDFSKSRWIFAACILFSVLLIAYSAFTAYRVMRRGSVAKDYLHPMAASWQSMRSWRRFLVFAELTKSKKGADYVALFCYFQFQGAIRVILAEGPRQIINALTLYSVMKANLVSSDPNPVASISQFGRNVRVLATTQPEHAVVLFTMLFSVIVWIFSFLSLVGAAFAYIGFLLHYIEGGNLTRYCKRKIEKRLGRIVAATFQKELERQEARRRRADERAARGPRGIFGRRGTNRSANSDSPTLPDVEEKQEIEALSAVLTRASATPSNPPGNNEPSYQTPGARAIPRRFSRVARAPRLPTIVASPRSIPDAFARRSLSSASAASSNSGQPLIVQGDGEADDAMAPAPLNIRRKPVPSLRDAIPVNPHSPPRGPIPQRPVPGHGLGRRASDAGPLPVPPPAPHSREAGGIGGPSTFAAMGF